MEMNESEETKKQMDDEYVRGNFYYYNYFRFSNHIEPKKFEIKIVELDNESNGSKVSAKIQTNDVAMTDEMSDENEEKSGKHERTEIPIRFIGNNSTSTDSVTDEDYMVEEPDEASPYDFIFEPEHCAPHIHHHYHQQHEHSDSHNSSSESTKKTNYVSEAEMKESVKRKHEDSTRSHEEDTPMTTTTTPQAPASETTTATSPKTKTSFKSFPIDRAARFKGENEDGVLEYEYLSARYTTDANSESTYTSEELEQMNQAFVSEFDLKHHHLNAIIRGISLVKWPTTGFGFSLTQSTNNNYIYVNEIAANSPAEFCLQVGDIIIEIDEMTPDQDFKSIEQIYSYMNEKEFIHLMVIHESKYFNLDLVSKQSSNATDKQSFYKKHESLLKDYCINCKDIVIVSWPKADEAKKVEDAK